LPQDRAAAMAVFPSTAGVQVRATSHSVLSHVSRQPVECQWSADFQPA
jgi:hypothetical protein